MTKPSHIFGIAAAFVLSVLPLAVQAGSAHSAYRPAQWQRSHDGQGVMRVYGGDAYRAPETYTGGEFRGGLNVQTAYDHADYEDEYYETSDRYAPPPAPCRSVCITAEAPPPPPPCAEARREVRYAQPRVVAREVVIEEEESREEYSEYYSHSSRDDVYRRPHAHDDDCPCQQDHGRQGHGYHEAGYNERYEDRYADDRYDDRYDDRRDDRYDSRYDRRDNGYRGDVFGRY